MKNGIGKIVIGLIFIGLGGTRVATSKGALAIFGGAMALYGLFSLGYGIYMIVNKKEDNNS